MNPKILMIEDDASICDMTKMNLNMNGFQHVYCASDGEEGWRSPRNSCPT